MRVNARHRPFFMSFLIEIFLPLKRTGGGARPEFNKTTQELSRRFGGSTAFTRAPADGRWKKRGKTIKDVMVVIEVMVSKIDRPWWRRYARTLAERFKQDQVLIRSTRVSRLDRADSQRRDTR